MKKQLLSHAEIQKVLDKDTEQKLSGEKVFFSDYIIKINKKSIEQKRILIITNEALYNFKEKRLKRRLEVKNIKGITTSKTSDELVVHGEGQEYDYHYKYKNKRKIIEIIAAVYFNNTSNKITFALVKKDNLKEFVTLNEEKKRNKKISKLNDQFLVDIDIYLYGNLIRRNSLGKPRKGTNFASVMKAQQSEIIFLNEKGSGFFEHLKDIKIENFRVLGDLIKSYYGQIYWTEFIPNNIFCLMRVIDCSDLNDFSLGADKITDIYSFDFISIPTPEIILKAGGKIFIINKFSPYFEGGPLFFHLKNSGTFNEQKTKIIAAQIINIILFAHKKKIKLNFSPENFILDKNGFINYLWFEIDEKTFLDKCKPKILKPPEYTLVKNDWYNLGILLYEMLFNSTPLNYVDSYGNLRFPEFMSISNEAKQLVEYLLCVTNEEQDFQLEDMKKFKFFEDINFDDVFSRKVESGITPMNLDMQKLNNMGIMTDENEKDQSEEMEKERYTLFNYDSNDEND